MRNVPRRDPVQRAAHAYVFVDLKNVSGRLKAFSGEDQGVRRQVLLELENRVELLSAGRAAAAWASIIGASVAAVTITGALLIAVFNGWFTTVVKLMDEKTGFVHGITQKQFTDPILLVAQIIGGSIGLLLFAAVVILIGATVKDKRRGISIAWLRLFTDAEAQRESARETMPAACGRWCRVLRFRFPSW